MIGFEEHHSEEIGAAFEMRPETPMYHSISLPQRHSDKNSVSSDTIEHNAIEFHEIQPMQRVYSSS